MQHTVSQACVNLLRGEVVGLPTETVYGLAADATSNKGVANVYAHKRRPHFHPLIVHVGSLKMAEQVGHVPMDLLRYVWMSLRWSVTVIVQRKMCSSVSLLATAGPNTVAIRYPQHPMAQEVIHRLGRPLVAPSANLFGQLSPVHANHVKAVWPNICVLDGGPCSLGLESTIVALTTNPPTVLRLGAVTYEHIQDIWPNAQYSVETCHVAASGTLKQHYQTSKPLYINQITKRTHGVLVGFGPMVCDVNLSLQGCVKEASMRLFQTLHDLDSGAWSSISVAPIPHHGLGAAINDRLQRAQHNSGEGA